MEVSEKEKLWKTFGTKRDGRRQLPTQTGLHFNLTCSMALIK